MNTKNKFARRKKRIRRRLVNSLRMRLSVFRSNKHIYGQIIDDGQGKSLFSVNDFKILEKNKKQDNKCDTAKLVGLEIAKKALKRKTTRVVFDKGGYKYHGRVKALAEGAREGGLKF